MTELGQTNPIQISSNQTENEHSDNILNFRRAYELFSIQLLSHYEQKGQLHIVQKEIHW